MGDSATAIVQDSGPEVEADAMVVTTVPDAVAPWESSAAQDAEAVDAPPPFATETQLIACITSVGGYQTCCGLPGYPACLPQYIPVDDMTVYEPTTPPKAVFVGCGLAEDMKGASDPPNACPVGAACLVFVPGGGGLQGVCAGQP